jgi:hypothetical protein
MTSAQLVSKSAGQHAGISALHLAGAGIFRLAGLFLTSIG